ncbi:MAG: Rab family GTPase [Promethearchaeota archaeon]
MVVKMVVKIGKGFRLKMVVVGDNAVGKTSLIKDFVEKKFTTDHRPTLGTNILMKKLDTEEGEVHLAIFDIAGQERWRKMRKAYYQGAHMAFVVGDVTRKQTFLNVKKFWAADLRENAESIAIVLLANKVDLEREITSEEVKEIAGEVGIQTVIETSAKTGQAVDLAFRTLVKQYFQSVESKRKEKGE